MQEKEVPCSWSQKGRMMRRLMEEARQEETEMIDGLKIYHPGGWAFILPDPERPAYRVFGEGHTEEIAESLTDFYFDRSQNLAQKRKRGKRAFSFLYKGEW